MKIAVIGAGVSGLVAARALAGHATVDVFEAAAQPGGHVHTVRAPAARGAVAVDMGFIVFNPARYPHFVRLLADLGVATRASDMSFSVRDARTGFEFGTASLAALGARWRDRVRPGHYRFLFDIVRFVRCAQRGLNDPALDNATLGAFLAREGLRGAVVEHFVVPLGAAIWSTPPAEVLAFPAATFLRFCDAHGMLALVHPPEWRTVVGGSQTYVRALLATLDARVHCDAPVRHVKRGDGVALTLADGATRRFDRVVLATHADQSLALLGDDATDAERRVLGAVGFTRNDAVLHTDASVLPRRPAARSSWNFVANEGPHATVTYWMNRLQGLDPATPFCVTLNPARPIAPAHVVARAAFAHPRFDLAAMRAQREVPRLQGARGTYYAGAWLGYGFHEDGVRSGLAAARLVRDDLARGVLVGDAP